MVAQIDNAALDQALTAINNIATAVYVCNAEPTTFALATTAGANALGSKSFTAGTMFGAPGPGGGATRSIVTARINGASVSNSGTASWWAVVSNTTLLAHGALAANVAVTAGIFFDLGPVTLTIPNH